MKPKFEVQESHVSRKQYILHCGIVEPGETKYVYHLCDDATHDAAFVHFVLEDIFESCNIKNGNVLIKSVTHLRNAKRNMYLNHCNR